MNLPIPILMYHQVTPNIHPKFSRWSVTPKTFAIHMKILNLHNYISINLNQLEDYKNGKANLPRKPIIITFDDSYRDAIDFTVPILKANRFTAVFFVPTDCVGSHSHWLMPDLGFEFPIIDWDTVKFLDTNEFQVGSHSMTHPDLTELTSEDCYKELAGSRKALEDHLGHEVVHLAYPHGLFDYRVRSIAAELGYHTASSVIRGFASRNDDPFALPRIEISGEDTLLDFVFKLRTAKKFKLRPYINNKIHGLKKITQRIILKIQDK